MIEQRYPPQRDPHLRTKQVTPELIAYIVAKIAREVAPKQIILFGSHARGNAGPDSDVDILVIAPEFDAPYDSAQVDLLWELRACTDSRIEPIAVGERRWHEDTASPIIEIARREGQEIVATAAV